MSDPDEPADDSDRVFELEALESMFEDDTKSHFVIAKGKRFDDPVEFSVTIPLLEQEDEGGYGAPTNSLELEFVVLDPTSGPRHSNGGSNGGTGDATRSTTVNWVPPLRLTVALDHDYPNGPDMPRYSVNAAWADATPKGNANMNTDF